MEFHLLQPEHDHRSTEQLARHLDSEEELRLKHSFNVEIARIHLQERLASFTCWCVRVGLIGALCMFFLQGFGNRSGFHLDAAFMHWLGGATLGCVSALAMAVYKCSFPVAQAQRKNTKPKKQTA